MPVHSKIFAVNGITSVSILMWLASKISTMTKTKPNKQRTPVKIAETTAIANALVSNVCHFSLLKGSQIFNCFEGSIRLSRSERETPRRLRVG